MFQQKEQCCERSWHNKIVAKFNSLVKIKKAAVQLILKYQKNTNMLHTGAKTANYEQKVENTHWYRGTLQITGSNSDGGIKNVK